VCLNAPLWLIKLWNRFDPILVGGNLPTGEIVVLSKGTLKHIKAEHGKTIRAEQILRCVENPEQLLRDSRPARIARGYIYATRLTVSPYSRQKVKQFVVHLKPCRVFLVFRAFFVATALNVKKLPPQGVVYWERPTGLA
jgi:hypothetical protein